MALPCAAAFVETEQHYRRIMDYNHLWAIKALVDETEDQEHLAKKRSVG